MARRKYETQLEQLRNETENGEIAEKDNELIGEYYNWIKGQKAETTVGNHLFHLRKLAYRADGTLTNMSRSEIEDLLDAMKGGTHADVKDEGIGVGNYQATLRVFYRYHDQIGRAHV